MSRSARKGLSPFVYLFNKFSLLLDFIFSFLEMHLVKLAAFAIMALCCSMVNALHLVVVMMLLLCLLFGISAVRISFSFIGPFLSFLFLVKMFYQTKFAPNFDLNTNCSAMNVTVQSTIENTLRDPEWWGFHVLKGDETLVSYYKGYVVVFVVLTFQSVIKIRQKIVRIDAGEPSATPHILYANTSRKDADKNLRECLKYLINYGFYKFGVEITLSFCAFLIAFRMDVFSVLYSLCIVIVFLLDRMTLSLVWPFFLTTLIFSILWQYAMAVGLSDKACFEYPWANQTSLVSWLFLPSFTQPPSTEKTLVDFVLLILIQRQQSVFELERRYGDRYLGGSNKEVIMNRETMNPTPDHTGNIKSWLDVVKFFFLRCFFRITLAFEFWNGASHASILSLGYLVGAFVFLWIDCDLCMWHIKKILKWWNILLGYTVFVIFFKTVVEFAGCVYYDSLIKHFLWLVELVFIDCDSAPHSKATSSIYWDAVCFALIIFQKRYFKSYYFLHEVDDVLAVNRLQAKGARLMDDLQESKLKEFTMHERRTLAKIKKNMNRIKAWQKRMHGLNDNEPTDHATAIYMGDYLMFENLDSISGNVEEESLSGQISEELKRPAQTGKNLTMSEFIGTVFKRATEDTPSIKGKKEFGSQDGVKGEGESDSLRDRKDSAAEAPSTRKNAATRRRSTLKSEDERDGKDRMKKAWKLFQTFLESIMVSMIHFFNKNSRDYIYIESKMKAERKIQKKIRRETSRDHQRNSRQSEGSTGRLDSLTSEDDRMTSQELREEDHTEEPYKKSAQALIVDLINSICMFIMSQTELLCYMIIFLYTILAPTLISLPLPLFVFMWGSLTTVRPTSTFWTVLIAYTEVTVVIKALFQNSIFLWNRNEKQWTILPENPPLFMGIHRDNRYVIADLFLLLLLFLHRYKLKTLGLWNRTHEEETFVPQNLKLYKELPPEGKRSKKFSLDLREGSDYELTLKKMPTWKCTSRATAKIIYWGNKTRTKIRIKEIEGQILVTHDGRRLLPTGTYVSQIPDDVLEGNIILRVYTNDTVSETKGLIYKLSWLQHLTCLRKFFIQIVVKDWRMSADFYTLMFVFEFLDFLIVFFGYTSFTSSNYLRPENKFSLAESQIPFMYLFTVISHFLVIIIDRILYLRKCALGKMIFQFILLILVHAWMFIVIPMVTESSFTTLYIPQAYYIISCFYFLMSAYQLRVGYPMRVQGHFLCKKYGYVNYYAYKGLQFIPFFNQLRTLLDFICIKSSMTMTEWIKMESIFQLVYENKCSRAADIQYPAPRGQECPKCPKYSPGVAVLLGMIIVIWLPFIIFALFNTVAQANLPQEASLNLRVGNFGIIYVSTATFKEILTLTETQYKFVQTLYRDNKEVWSFLSLFDAKDIAVLKFRFEPYEPWSITGQELEVLNETVQNVSNPITLYLMWSVQRIPRSQIVYVGKGFNPIYLNAEDRARQDLRKMFINRKSNVFLDHVLPKFLHVTNEGEAIPVRGFLNGTEAHRSISLTLEGDDRGLWWKLTELPDETTDMEKINKLPFHSTNEITIYTFNDKNLPKLLLNISKRGIIGLYLSIVFVLWTLVKRAMWRYPYIMFSDMPNPDPVLQLCHDIYLARESHEFALEEDLFAKLLFLFRSPETMIEVTRLTNLNPT